jgi:cell division protein FtsB
LETGKSIFSPNTPISALVKRIESDEGPMGMHPVLKSIVERGWKADPEERPTMAEICTELSEVDWLVFDGPDAGRVKREAAALSLSQSVSKAMLQTRLSETQARVWGLEHEVATLKSQVNAQESENSTLKAENCAWKAEVAALKVGEVVLTDDTSQVLAANGHCGHFAGAVGRISGRRPGRPKLMRGAGPW